MSALPLPRPRRPLRLQPDVGTTVVGDTTRMIAVARFVRDHHFAKYSQRSSLPWRQPPFIWWWHVPTRREAWSFFTLRYSTDHYYNARARPLTLVDGPSFGGFYELKTTTDTSDKFAKHQAVRNIICTCQTYGGVQS